MGNELETAEEARAKRKAAAAEAREAQHGLDRKVFEDLQEEFGDAAVRWLSAPGHIKGLPTGVVIKAPTSSQYARFQDQLTKANARNDAKAKREAHETLAEGCWIYPAKEEKETRKALVEAFAALHVSIAIEANRMAEFQADEAGKD